jgi:cytochrome c biogenesis protein CcdA
MISWLEVLLAVLDAPCSYYLSCGYRLPLAASVFAITSAISAPILGFVFGLASSPASGPLPVLYLNYCCSADSIVLNYILG